MQTICECNHRKEEHRGGENCEACKCTRFTPKKSEVKLTVCIECRYVGTEEICIPCQKKITDNYPGDLINYLFGIKGDHPAIDKIKAKKLAMEIHAAGLDISSLWECYKGGNHV